MPLSCDRILDLDVVLGKIFDRLWLHLIFSVSMTQFAIWAAAEGVKLTEYMDEYPDYPMATTWSVPMEALYIFSGRFMSW